MIVDGNAGYIVGRETGFVSVREPYSNDVWVAENFSDVDPSAEVQRIARTRFQKFLAAHRLLPVIINSAAEMNRESGDNSPLEIIDCGVYMGMFSIAAGLSSENAGVIAAINAYEANPFLVEPIQRNFSLYGLDIELHNNGVGRSMGTLEFVHPKGHMIGGTLHNTKSKKDSEFVSTFCSVVPLSSIISDGTGIGIIKLDIEGSEIDAFASIIDFPNKIKNLFVVEFAPWQGLKEISPSLLYGKWLLDNFLVFGVGSWAHSQKLIRFANEQELEHSLDGNKRSFNTDLVLVPRELEAVAQRIASQF